MWLGVNHRERNRLLPLGQIPPREIGRYDLLTTAADWIKLPNGAIGCFSPRPAKREGCFHDGSVLPPRPRIKEPRERTAELCQQIRPAPCV